MRKIYILREMEEDGSVLDAMEARGLPADMAQIRNPTCPSCGAPTLLGYAKAEQFAVLTWYCLTEPDQGAAAEHWYLLCSSLSCQYEEPVLRVNHPMGAELFDLEQSHNALDESCGLLTRGPASMRELIQRLQEVSARRPTRKLTFFVQEAQSRYEEGMEQVRRWLLRVPVGREIQFRLGERYLRAIFLAHSGDRFLVLDRARGDMLAVELEHISAYSPRHFDEAGSAAEPTLVESLAIAREEQTEMVEVQGYHLLLEQVDRLGQYHVQSRDEEAAMALGLTALPDGSWSGIFRRAEIQALYHRKLLVRVEGYWLEVWGRAPRSDQPAVRTDDPIAGAALGLRPVRPPRWEEEGPRPITHWTGVIPWELVEAKEYVRIYQWPTPRLERA